MTPSSIPLPLSLPSSKASPRKDVPPSSSSVHPLTPKYKGQTRQKLYSSVSTSSLSPSSSLSPTSHHNTTTRHHTIRPDIETLLQNMPLDRQEEEEGHIDVDRSMTTLDGDHPLFQRKTRPLLMHSPITPLPGSCVFFETESQGNEDSDVPTAADQDTPPSSQEREPLTASASAGTARKCQSTDVCMSVTFHFSPQQYRCGH